MADALRKSESSRQEYTPIDKSPETLAALRKESPGVRERFEVPETQPKLRSVELPTVAEHLPLHNTFIALREVGFERDKTQKVGRAYKEVRRYSSEQSAQSTDEYLAEGRGAENIAEARKADLAILEPHEAMIKRGEEVRRQRELAEKEEERTAQESSVFRRFFNAAVELGVQFRERYQNQMDALEGRARDVVAQQEKRSEAAQSALFNAMTPAETATPEQAELLADAQAVHRLAEELEKGAA